MAQYRDIDLPTGVSLRVNGGDLTIPSNNLTVGGTISESGTLLSAKYLGISAKAADSEKLDNLDSTQFMRSDASTSTSGNLSVTGTTKLAGAFYAGTTNPTNTNRLNFDGAFYATQLYDGAVRVALSTRSLIAGSGLTGGGDLTADRTFAISWGGNGSATTSSRSDHDHNATYLGIAAKAADSELLDGINSTQFVRNDTTNSIAGLVTITTGGLVVNSGGIDSGTTITYGVSATKGRLNYSAGTVILEATSTNTSVDIKSTGTGIVKINGNTVYHAGNFTPSQYVKNDTSGQSVNGNFTVAGDGNLWVGANGGTSGDVLVRNGSVVTIQLDAQSDNKQTGVMSYIDGAGNAQFSGNVLVNNLQINSSGNIANLNASYISGVKEIELAKNASILELGGRGVYSGMSVSQQTVPNMTVLIAAGTGYTNSGRRFSYSSQSVSLTASSATYGRYDAVYVRGSSAGANEGDIIVLAGTPAPSPVIPTIPTDGYLLATIFVGQNVGSILDANITDAREFKTVIYDSSDKSLNLRYYLDVDNIRPNLNNTVWFSAPIRGSFATTKTITAGTTSVTWTHNFNIASANYAITFSTNSPNRHIYWTNKTANAITINIDDTTDVNVVVDAVITAY